MDNDSTYFLPSEIARLILGYLENEGYTTTGKAFMKECVYLQEYVTLLKRGRQYPVTINGFSLVEMLEKFAQFYLMDVNKQTTGLSNLWNQLESVMACLKRHTAYKNIRIEGVNQNSRTRRGNLRAKYEVDEKGDSSKKSVAENVLKSPQKVRLSHESERSENRQSLNVLLSPKKSVDETRSKVDGVGDKISIDSGTSQILHTGAVQTKHFIVKSPSAISKVKSHDGQVTDTNIFESSHKISYTEDLSLNSENQSKENRRITTVKSTLHSNLISKPPDEEEYVDCNDLSDNDADSGAGFHDDVMDCDSNTQLSPLPTSLRNDDVKESSGEGARLLDCDQINKDNLTICDKTGRENMTVCDKTGRENLTVCDKTSRETLTVCDKTGRENLTVCDKTGRENLTVCDKTGRDNLTVCDKTGRDNLTVCDKTDMVLSQVTVNDNNLSENTSIQCQQSDPPTTDTSVQEPSHDISMVTPSTQADLVKGNEECVIPIIPKKHAAHSDLPLLSTSGKNLREYGFHGQGKSPRRKRPPKRKSQADNTKDKRSSLTQGNLNDSSNSTDGSQFLEKLLNNPLLHEKLAENINKTIHCSDISKSESISYTSLTQTTSYKDNEAAQIPSINLEDILDPHETQMTQGQINSIIDMTEGDTVLDSLLKLFNQDSRIGSDKEKILKDNNNIDIMASESTSIPTISHNTPVTSSTFMASVIDPLNFESTSGFKPINSADVMGNESLLSFPTISIRDVYEKTVENKYVSENSIDAVLNPSACRQTLNTPTDFSVISSNKSNAQHSANVNTSMSSSIAPTITISKVSNFQISVQSPHIQSVSPACLNQSSSSQLCQASSLLGSVCNSESSKCLLSTAVSKTKISVPEDGSSVSNNRSTTDISTPLHVLLPVTNESSKRSKTGSYTSFVKGVTDNSSTPVDARGPSTVQFEDNSRTFQELPSEVKNLYSSFEQNVSDISKSQEEIQLDQNEKTTKSAKKNKQISPKPPSINKQKQKESANSCNKISKSECRKKETNEKLKSGCSSKIKLNCEESSTVNENKMLSLSSDGSGAGILKSGKKKKSQISTSKTAGSDEKKSPVSTKNDSNSSRKKRKNSKSHKKKLSPKPKIRCDPLQPRSDNKGNKSSKAAPKPSYSKWSTGLSALIKIASPEKPKTDATENGQRIAPDNTQISPTTQKDGLPIKRLFGDDIDQRTPLLRNTSSEVVASMLQISMSKHTTSNKSSQKVSAKSQSNKEPETFLRSISPTAREITEDRTSKSPEIIKLGPSCLGEVKVIIQNVNSEHDQPSTEACTNQTDINTNLTEKQIRFCSMPLLDGSDSHIVIQQSDSVFTPRDHIRANHIGNNLATTPESTVKHSQPLPSVSNVPNSAFDDTFYSESIDFLESPRKHILKTNTDVRISCGDENEAEQNPIQPIYTATPLTDLFVSQQIHIRTLDVENVSDTSQSPGQQKPKRQYRHNKKPVIKPATNRGGKKSEKKVITETKRKKTLLDVLNTDSRSEAELETSCEPIIMAGTSVNIVRTVKMPRPVISTNSIGLSSIMDRESTNDMVPMQKHKSIYRPLSETESEDGSNLVIFVNDIKDKMSWGEHDDFIPDAEGNIHMNSGQIINSPSSKKITQLSGGVRNKARRKIPMQLGNDVPVQSQKLVHVPVQSQKLVQLLPKKDVPVQSQKLVQLLPKKDVPVQSQKLVQLLPKKDVPVQSQKLVQALPKNDVPVQSQKLVQALPKTDVPVQSQKLIQALPQNDLPVQSQKLVQALPKNDVPVQSQKLVQALPKNDLPVQSQKLVQALPKTDVPVQSQKLIQALPQNDLPVQSQKLIQALPQNDMLVQSQNVVQVLPQKQVPLKVLGNKEGKVFDLTTEKCFVSPSCKKLMGQLGIFHHSDTHLGRRLNNSWSMSSKSQSKSVVTRCLSSDSNHGNTSKQSTSVETTAEPLVSMPAFYDIHLTRESSNDTCSSELEHIISSAKMRTREKSDSVSSNGNQTNEDTNSRVETHLFENNEKSSFSTDSEEIDVEGDWENPWTNMNSHLSHDSNDVILTENSQHVTICEGNHVTIQNSPDFKLNAPTDSKRYSDDLTSSSSTFTGTVQTSQSAQLTSRLMNTPPKKRVTASMKCGSGLYFFSTHGNGNDTEHKSENAEKSTKSKRTPKDNLGHVTNLRRSPRIKTTMDTTDKKLHQPNEQIEKVKRNLSDIGKFEIQKEKQNKRGSKRQREESEGESSGTESTTRAKKCKTPVDLTKLNVDKFLTKLYKN